MLNLRKIKQDFASNILKDGKELFAENKVITAKILHLDATTLRVSARIMGQYENTYASEIEIDRKENEAIDSSCSCSSRYDCQHLAALVCYMEVYLDEILVNYSKETNLSRLTDEKGFDDEAKEKLLEAVKEAETKEEQRRDEEYQKEVLAEYTDAATILSDSPFFRPAKERKPEEATFSLIYHFPPRTDSNDHDPIVRIVVKPASRSKPLAIPDPIAFFEGIRHRETVSIGGREYYFTPETFNETEREIILLLTDSIRHVELRETKTQARGMKLFRMDSKVFGRVLARARQEAASSPPRTGKPLVLPCLYHENTDRPLKNSDIPARIKMTIEFIHPPTTKILVNPHILLGTETIAPEDAELIECETPGLIYEDIYYRFDEKLTRKHLRSLIPIRDMTIPEPLFGTFVEHALPQLRLFAEVDTHDLSNHFTTLPFEGKPEAICNLSFLNGELEASLLFRYGERVVPYSLKESDYEHVVSFTGREGITARNLTEERELAEELFCEFLFNPETHVYCTKTDKKIIDFMTLVIPRFRDRVRFNCPRNLLDRFIYESTEFTVTLSETPQPSNYEIALEVKGPLQGVRVDCMWDRIVSGRSYLEKEGGEGMPKTVLAFDLKEMNEVIRLFDEMGIEKLENMTVKRALWSLANIDEKSFEGLPVTFRMTRRLRDIRKQMLGEKQLTFSPVPEKIRATLRNYQIEGIRWLERLRFMYLSGILADDMGLGKTVQALVAITQHLARATEPALVVCPTSLVYNWKEECHKFNPDLRVLVIDGMPAQRKRLIENAMRYDVVITSYSLLQKDIEPYESIRFSYMILDEAQHIKNRGTRNAKSVKRIKAQHRLVLSGTPIENALEELWSLFDFLMPGFLGSYERFVERYLRSVGKEQVKHLTYLRKKVAPFILRRMKEDVLDEVPPLSENIYHTQLTGTQKELYRSYAKSARDELVKLVERDGFDKVQIHVLATLTRLKQICCHPAIFAKERAEPGDSAKYDMLLELLETLIEGNHKSVIFSQYTKMLRIMQTDFERLGIRFAYLDGASKDRLETVKRFNEDPAISVFLVSLKAGGTGLNLVGADTVIHYDMWWNPAVENQATDRVYRIGQKEKVSVYKLVTLDTIEEKIVEMQNKKKGIVKKIVSCDDEAVTKLTWEDVLELLRT